MTTTTDVVHRSFRQACHRRGYFFREAAMLTIAMGVCLHLFRVICGDAATLRYAMTPLTDAILLVPMTYAAVTGILTRRRMVFVNRPHMIAVTAAIAYISLSVPLHLYVLLVMKDVSFYVGMAGPWFSYLLLCAIYPVFLAMLWRVRYKN
ncbi:hypothetical protein ACNO8X_05535 [Mycobacterium sp. PDNC021]|uniref:hypothetical protein n=1 Tax=Mycobacterium sp. PDNC021 TaxID=3391399 RepID=UPI003AAD32C3